jgi:hypothetical protein
MITVPGFSIQRRIANPANTVVSNESTIASGMKALVPPLSTCATLREAEIVRT